jgi:hypothetical protein
LPEGPKKSRIAELRKHEVYAPPPIAITPNSPTNLEINK